MHKHKEQTYASLHHKPSHELELSIARFLPFAFQYLSIRPTGYQSNPSRYQTKRSWVRVPAAPFFVCSFFTIFLNTLFICPKPNLVGPTRNGQQRSSFQTRLRLVPPETAESRRLTWMKRQTHGTSRCTHTSGKTENHSALVAKLSVARAVVVNQ